MVQTVDALKELYVSLGGELTDTYAGIAGGATVGNYVTIPDCIQAVTKKAEASGGAEIFTVTISVQGEGDPTADKTYQEIVAAVNAGNIVYLNWDNRSSGGYNFNSCNNISLAGISNTGSNETIDFMTFYIGDGEVSFVQWMISEQDTITIYETTLS